MHLYAACRLSITHYYEPGDHTLDPCTGTGFLVKFPTGDNRLGLVTNRHLTDIPWHLPQRDGTVIKYVEAELWQSERLRLKIPISDPEPIYHEDPTIDVAIIPFGPKFEHEVIGTPFDRLENLDPSTFNFALHWEYLEECEKLWPMIQPGEFVAFPGYPKWYDKSELRPVLRSGVIASDPQRNYRRLPGPPSKKDGNEQVLFDAFSTSGNSGSPVFVAARGMAPVPVYMTDADGNFAPYGRAAQVLHTGYHRSFLIGINAGHIRIEEDEGDASDDSRNDHAGLSRLYKLSTIMHILRTHTEPNDEPNSMTLMIEKSLADAQASYSLDHSSTVNGDEELDAN